MATDRAIKQARPVARSDLNDPCLLCEIVAGRAEASLAYEDEHVIAIMDLYPVARGHLFVFPRAHAESLETLDDNLGAHLFRVARRLARALYRSGLPCGGVNMFLADGAAAFQEVFHVHLHVFPRTPGDSFHIDADWRQRDRAELDATAEQVRRGLHTVSESSPHGPDDPGRPTSQRDRAHVGQLTVLSARGAEPQRLRARSLPIRDGPALQADDT